MYKLLKSIVVLVLVGVVVAPVAVADDPCDPDVDGCETIVVVSKKKSGGGGGSGMAETMKSLTDDKDKNKDAESPVPDPEVVKKYLDCSDEQAEVDRIEQEIERLEKRGGTASASDDDTIWFAPASRGLIQNAINQHGSGHVVDGIALGRWLKLAEAAWLQRNKELNRLKRELAMAREALMDCLNIVAEATPERPEKLTS